MIASSATGFVEFADWCPDSQEAKETASSLKWDFILQKRLDTVVDNIRDIQDLLETLE